MIPPSSLDDPGDIFEAAFGKIERHHKIRHDRGEPRERISCAKSEHLVPYQTIYFSYQSGWTYSDSAVSARSMARSSSTAERNAIVGKSVCPQSRFGRGMNLNDLCTHAKASNNAMTARPVSASEIRYTVMSTSSSFCAHCGRRCDEQPDCSTGTRNGVFNMRQIAGVAIFGARTLCPWLQGPRAAVAQATPRAGTFARAG